jgi:hypothetical protein
MNTVIIDWSSVITQLLIIVLPSVFTFAFSYAATQWAALKKNEKFANSIAIIEGMAENFITVAWKLGEVQGWDAKFRHDFVLMQLHNLAAKLHIPVSDEELDQILDAILETQYDNLKSSKYSSVETPKNIGA